MPLQAGRWYLLTSVRVELGVGRPGLVPRHPPERWRLCPHSRPAPRPAPATNYFSWLQVESFALPFLKEPHRHEMDVPDWYHAILQGSLAGGGCDRVRGRPVTVGARKHWW